MNVPEDHYDGEKWFDNQWRPGVWRKTWDSYGGHWVMEFKRTNEFDAPIASTKNKIVSGVQTEPRTINTTMESLELTQKECLGSGEKNGIGKEGILYLYFNY